MTVKAKYKTPFGIFWKYFHTVAEMEQWFQENKICKLISYETGNNIVAEAKKYGYV